MSERGALLWDASIALLPLPATQDLSFQIDSTGLTVGQVQRVVHDKDELMELLREAANGTVRLSNEVLTLPSSGAYDFYSEMSHRERWFSELHLQIIGSSRPIPSSAELANIDNGLRLAHPPFDGLSDATAWLGLRSPMSAGEASSISIRVGPPVDLIFDRCALAEDRLHLTLNAHPEFDVSRVGLAMRTVPGNGLAARQQVANQITWNSEYGGRLEGVAHIDLQHADQVLVMLMVGSSTVRRQWFVDPAKARNNRLLAVQHFDRELKMIKQAVLESTESAKFEKGVAALLFLVGFSPVLSVETDAPDLIVTTPGGKLVIVECTTRIADFASKVGKLVDRRGSLSKSLTTSGHPATVSAVLVCRLPRDQIAAQASELRSHNTILVTGEDLSAAFDRLRFPNDPDRILDEALARVSSGASDSRS